VLDTNAWLAGGELDVVARRGETLVFCEVKSKADARFGDPLEMVGPVKMRRIRRVAEAWLAARPELAELTVRFDVMVERAGRLECVRDAF
jgi:putative endonuclease